MMKLFGLKVVTSCVDHVHHDLKEEKTLSKLAIFASLYIALLFAKITPKTDTEKTLYPSYKMNNGETFRFKSSY